MKYIDTAEVALIGMSLMLIGAIIAIIITSPHNDEEYSYQFFPICDKHAPIHVELSVQMNSDAVIVAQTAVQTGWSNVIVHDHTLKPAIISADCQYGHI